jgi:diguanylate cyclase (GGDEF)-like protein
MSILPLLVSIYLLLDYILPQQDFKLDQTVTTLMTIILLSIVLAILGFLLIKEVFGRIVSVCTEAKLIAAGDVSRSLKVECRDELGDLSGALNEITQRVLGNMGELKNYSEKTTEINIEIQERVVVFSSLLQISSLISQAARLEDIVKLTVEKSRLIGKSEISYLLLREEGQDSFSMKVSDGADAQHLLKLKVWPREELFNKIVNSNKPLLIDHDNTLPSEQFGAFYEKFRIKNTLALPVCLGGRVTAILGIGNNIASFSYRRQDMELLDIFAKQIAIAIENDILTRRLEKLEIKDTLTGLYNETFIRSRLQEEIKRAITYQRPCAFILLNIDNFKNFHDKFGSLEAETILKRIAYLIRDSVTEIDRVGRIGEDEFAIILPERNKRRAQDIAEDIRKKIEFTFSEEADISKRVTVSGGVSENPLDGIGSEELIVKARQLLEHAKKQGKNRISAFKEPPV